MSPKLRASLDDGRYRPKDPWVHAFGRSYRVIGDKVHVLYVRKGHLTADFVLRTYFRTIPPDSPRYRAVMRRYRERCK
jgi:hypothetical protein